MWPDIPTWVVVFSLIAAGVVGLVLGELLVRAVDLK